MKGTYELYKLGADMTALGANGRNFADMCKGNKNLRLWWEDRIGLRATGRVAEPREDMYRRTGCSDARFARLLEGKGNGKLGRGKGKARGKGSRN